MEDFKIEDRYVKLCYEFRAFTRCMDAAFYRPYFQRFLMCPLIERLGQAFVLNRPRRRHRHKYTNSK